MEIYTLNCFKEFECKKELCNDTCCAGWDIVIDKKTLEYYRALKGEFGDFLRANIDFSHSCIKTEKDGRCPFLNGNNLCEIILNCGEEHISYICTHHPRFYNEISGFTEMGMGLCCEEATRLLMDGDIRMEKRASKETSLLFFRDGLMDMVFCENFSLYEKLYYFLDLVCETEELLLFGEEDKAVSIKAEYKFKKIKTKGINVKEVLEIAKCTEPIDKIWEERLNAAIESEKKIKGKINEIICVNKNRYERLFYYYIFRYLLNDAEDKELICRAKLIIYLLYLNIIFDAEDSKNKDFNKNTVLISKQIEYSEENIDFILCETYTNPAFDFGNLVGEEL